MIIDKQKEMSLQKGYRLGNEKLDKGLHFNNLMSQVIYIGDWNIFNQNKKYHLQVTINKCLFLEVNMLMTKNICEYIFLEPYLK